MPRSLLALLVLASSLALTGCPGPSGDPVCTITNCEGSWGLIGYNAWACDEETGLAWTEAVELVEGPFPRSNTLEQLECGQPVTDLLSTFFTDGFATGTGCAGLGVPADRIGDPETICEEEGGGSGDDDDSAGDDDDSAGDDDDSAR